jgi:hypothetical protein
MLIEHSTLEKIMKYALIAAALIATAALGTAVQAQEVMSNPGYCAQFYPNANCQNKGAGNPYTDARHANLNPIPQVRTWHRAELRHQRMDY